MMWFLIGLAVGVVLTVVAGGAWLFNVAFRGDFGPHPPGRLR